MRMMEELKELLWDELEKFADKGVISMADLESIHKITDTIKNIKKIEMYDDGYSRGGNWEAVGTYGDYHRNLKRNSRGRSRNPLFMRL